MKYTNQHDARSVRVYRVGSSRGERVDAGCDVHLSAEDLQDERNSHLPAWVRAGWLKCTDGRAKRSKTRKTRKAAASKAAPSSERRYGGRRGRYQLIGAGSHRSRPALA
jgi:hypothetical protein